MACSEIRHEHAGKKQGQARPCQGYSGTLELDDHWGRKQAKHTEATQEEQWILEAQKEVDHPRVLREANDVRWKDHVGVGPLEPNKEEGQRRRSIGDGHDGGVIETVRRLRMVVVHASLLISLIVFVGFVHTVCGGEGQEQQCNADQQQPTWPRG